ncbi:MAG: hypothetical protein PF518_19910, partial [Spirochaetaceae bacterium]|nr:hypothetical protein [Spirochaetaceae bacterium]
MYLLMRTHFVYSFIADTQIVFKIELVCLFALLPFISAFFELITVDKISRVTKGYSLYSLLMVVAAIVTPINFNLDILRIWQVTGLIMILYIFFYLICWKFFSKASRRWKRQRTLKQSKSRIAVFFDALRETAVGNLFIGST